ncbi:hypothetical protein HMY34_07980 [Thiothrix subterranea]|uniref:hypothetical protein n=1 Tax=Thiothrix subterranea TaxID=2735563 RepID=UPI00192C9960|nr:hypothetical protein [Thiothrix subterranea]QQZ28699.1 hypothetical protein HMY34_07980 [Thiothrix subterranea]
MKVTTDKPKPTKLVCNIWRPLISRLEVKIKDACLNRDAFLDRVLKYEAKMLEKEITQPNSLKAKRYISDSLTRDMVKPVTFYLSEETITIINEKCKKFNILRDCFINRVIFLMIVPENIINNIFFKFNDGDYEYDQKMSDYCDYTSDCDEKYISWQSSLIGIINDYIEADPFWYLRSCLYGKQEEYKLEGASLLHSKSIGRGALAKLPEDQSLETANALFLNCFLSDFELDMYTLFYPVSPVDLQKEKEERKQKREQMKMEQNDQVNRRIVSK